MKMCAILELRGVLGTVCLAHIYINYRVLHCVLRQTEIYCVG